MRIVSYNILDGGEGRADPLAEVIEAQRPDVVGLVEAEELSVVERIARRLGMDFVMGIGKGKKTSVLLSRYPIVDSVNHGAIRREITKSLLEATVKTPEFGEVAVSVVHLAAGAFEADEREREKEIGVVLKIFEKYRQQRRPHFLIGDFNANSPVQNIEPNRCKEKTRKAWEDNGGKLPRRVVQRLLDAGYVDTLEAVDPEKAKTQATFTTKDPGQRVDYIFSAGVDRGRIKSAWIETDRLATYASDHYPVCVEII